MLFTELSLWTMLHGVVLGGLALMGLAAALFALYGLRAEGSPALARLTQAVAAVIWVTTIVGTYVIFPPYRVTPPEGATELAAYPRSLLLADPGTAWLHAFAMESKEHMPWIAAMLATAAAFVISRRSGTADPRLRRMTAALLALSFLLVSAAGVLGTFVNKVAPLQ